MHSIASVELPYRKIAGTLCEKSFELANAPVLEF